MVWVLSPKSLLYRNTRKPFFTNMKVTMSCNSLTTEINKSQVFPMSIHPKLHSTCMSNVWITSTKCKTTSCKGLNKKDINNAAETVQMILSWLQRALMPFPWRVKVKENTAAKLSCWITFNLTRHETSHFKDHTTRKYVIKTTTRLSKRLWRAVELFVVLNQDS